MIISYSIISFKVNTGKEQLLFSFNPLVLWFSPHHWVCYFYFYTLHLALNLLLPVFRADAQHHETDKEQQHGSNSICVHVHTHTHTHTHQELLKGGNVNNKTEKVTQMENKICSIWSICWTASNIQIFWIFLLMDTWPIYFFFNFGLSKISLLAHQNTKPSISFCKR